VATIGLYSVLAFDVLQRIPFLPPTCFQGHPSRSG
jgi:hypothetical protein